jgi:hypothetical protein
MQLCEMQLCCSPQPEHIQSVRLAVAVTGNLKAIHVNGIPYGPASDGQVSIFFGVMQGETP